MPLALPDIPRQVPRTLRTCEAAGHERQLAGYYERVVRLAEQHQMPFDRIRHYFWLRLWLWNGADKVRVSFPWYDTFAEIDGFLSWLCTAQPGEVYEDVEQGWELEVHVEEDKLLVLEGDPDAEEAGVLVSVPRAPLVVAVELLRERSVEIIDRLSRLLGADVWTAHVESPTFRAKDVP